MADEHRPRAALAQGLRDADAIERGAEARFRKQRDGRSVRATSSAVPLARHGEQGRRAAAGRLRPLAARQPQMHPQQIGGDLVLPAFELVEDGEMLARRLLQPKDVDAGQCARQAAQPEMVGQRLGRRSGWTSLARSCRGSRGRGAGTRGCRRTASGERQLRLHAVPQRRRLGAVQPEARRQHRGGFEQQAELVALGERVRTLRRRAEQPGLAGRPFDQLPSSSFLSAF